MQQSLFYINLLLASLTIRAIKVEYLLQPKKSRAYLYLSIEKFIIKYLTVINIYSIYVNFKIVCQCLFFFILKSFIVQNKLLKTVDMFDNIFSYNI